MEDKVVVLFPRRDWALTAIDDLRPEGCRAELLPDQAPDGSWRLQVTGPPEKIFLIRQAMQPIQRVCWEAFVNATIGV